MFMNKKKGIDLSTINADDTPILRKRQKKRLVEEKKEEPSTTTSPIDTLKNIKTNESEIELGKAGEVLEPEEDVIVEMFEEPITQIPQETTPEDTTPKIVDETPEFDPEYILIDDINEHPNESVDKTVEKKPKKDGLFKQLKEEYKELSKGFKIISTLLLLLSVVILGVGLFFYNKTSKHVEQPQQPAPQVEQKQEQPKEEDNTSEKDKLQNTKRYTLNNM